MLIKVCGILKDCYDVNLYQYIYILCKFIYKHTMMLSLSTGKGFLRKNIVADFILQNWSVMARYL